jgi:hypothetical protein
LPVQHLGHQVLGDRPLAAAELRSEPLRIWVPGHRQRGQPQPGRPALGSPHQRRQRGLGQLNANRLEQRPRLIEAELRVGGTDLGQLALQPQPVQVQPRLLISSEPAIVFRSASRTEIQNRCGSRSPACTATHAAQFPRPDSAIQDRIR